MINNLTLRKIEKLNEDEKVKVLRSYFYYLYAKFNLNEQRDLKNALIFKKYIKLDNSKEDEYIIIKSNDVKSMLVCAGEEYESILPILMFETEDNFKLSKKIKNNNK